MSVVHKNICCGYSLEIRKIIPKLSPNSHLICCIDLLCDFVLQFVSYCCYFLIIWKGDDEGWVKDLQVNSKILVAPPTVQNENWNKQCLLDTPYTVTVNKENYYQEYKGHTKRLSLISSHFAKKKFCFLAWHFFMHMLITSVLYVQSSDSFSRSSGSSWFPHVCTI